MPPARAYAVVATHRRPVLLARLLDSLAPLGREGLAGVVVADNGGDPVTAEVVRSRPVAVAHLPLAGNPGFGPALAHGFRWVLEHTDATHVLVSDDDAVWPPDALTTLLATAAASQAGMVVPLIVDADGFIGHYPGLADTKAFRAIRGAGLRPEEFRARTGSGPFAFNWAPAGAWLLSREAIAAVGLPREDFGFMAEDIEYSLRVSQRFPAVLEPRVVVEHLPSRAKRGPEADAVAALHLQNLAYLSCRLSHGKRSLRHLPGGIWRFVRVQPARRCVEALRLVWLGAGRGLPGGAPGADRHWRELRRVLNAS